MLVMMLYRKNRVTKIILIVFLPAIVMTVFLFVSPVANNKRYFLPMIYCVPILFAYCLYNGELDEKKSITYNSSMKRKLRDFVSAALLPLKALYGWVFFHIYWTKPLEDKVVFSCFSGKRYGDSPKYISIKLHETHPEVKQVWLYEKQKLKGLPKYIKQEERHSKKALKELATAKVWVNSHYQPCWMLKRKKGQFFIQTWHGGIGFKKIGLDAVHKIPFVELVNLKSNAKKVDIWVTDSDWSVNVHRKANNYKGNFLKSGLPRTEFLVKDEKVAKTRVQNFYGIEKNKKIALYVPTMRYNPGQNDFMIDVDGVLDSLKKSFGGDWVFMIRLHPANQNIQKQIINLYKDVYNGMEYDDVQDLIAGADACISDYSSAVFDSAILRHPTFCFAFDKEKYEGKERGFYQKPEDLPFPVAKDNDELCKVIAKFDKKKYKKELDEYFEKVGLYDEKDSTRKVVDLIETKLIGLK